MVFRSPCALWILLYLLQALGCSRDNPYDKMQSMRISSIPVVLITEEERDRLLDEGYSPQQFNGIHTRDRFYDEWFAASSTISQALKAKWSCGFQGEDFFMDSDPPDDRMLCVEVSNVRMITSEVLITIHAALKDLEHKYCVDVCNSIATLQQENGQPYPDFNVFVDRDRIAIYSAAPETIERFECARP